MGLIGDFAKGMLILTFAFWVFLIVEFAWIGQSGMALFLFLVLLIPLSMITYEYRKYKRKS